MLLRDSIYGVIREAILTCEFQPGQELREQALAERYRVSRSPVRDALLRLEGENLVTVLPREGYQVKPISMSDVSEVCGLRLLIEPACAIAAAQADETALQVLERFRGFAEQDYTVSEYVAYNQAFHGAVADLAGNKRMAYVARDLIGQVERLVRVTMRTLTHDAVSRICMEHEAIIEALQARDVDRAFELSHAHVESSNARIMSAVHRYASMLRPGDL